MRRSARATAPTTHLTRAGLLLAAAALALAAPSLDACSADNGAGDSGFGRVDSGASDTAEQDSGGSEEDSGEVSEDSEAPVEDSGGSALDATPPPMDAPRDDARPAPADTGPPREAGPATDSMLPPISGDSVLPGAPGDAPARFDRATPAASLAPTVVYPPEGVVVPANLPSFEVHFRPAPGTDLFELSFEGLGGRVRVYTNCTRVGDGCVATLDEATMARIGRAAQPGDQVNLTVSGMSAGGTTAGRAAPRDVGIPEGNLRGGVYYWAASEAAIVRFEFGLPGARPEAFLRGDPINCVGCHALSRDGRQMFVGRFIPGTNSNLLNVTTRAYTSGNLDGSNFATFSPDASHVLTSNGSSLVLRDGTTGARVAGLPPNAAGTMPDWSPDGRSVVYVIPATSIPFGNPGHTGRADLFLLPWSGGSFGAPTPLARSAGPNQYYPSFAPDSRWVVFNQAAESSYDAVDAHLWAVQPSPSGGAGTPVRLARADGTGDLSNSWPRFAPFTQNFRGETLYWFTFSSRRNYGLRIVQEGRAREGQVAQLWMAGFLPSRGASGDPSTAAFWVPFQNPRGGNHIAQWTMEVRRRSCTTDMDCMNGERCRSLAAAGVCVGN